MTDRIEKSIEIEAPVSRVWHALTDHQEFGKWFRVRVPPALMLPAEPPAK